MRFMKWLAGGVVAVQAMFLACQVGPTMAIAQQQPQPQPQVQALEAPCDRVTPTGQVRYATFVVPGFDPATSGPINARTCGSIASTLLPGSGATCFETSAYSAPGKIYVYCGQDSSTGSARIWVH